MSIRTLTLAASRLAASGRHPWGGLAVRGARATRVVASVGVRGMASSEGVSSFHFIMLVCLLHISNSNLLLPYLSHTLSLVHAYTMCPPTSSPKQVSTTSTSPMRPRWSPLRGTRCRSRTAPSGPSRVTTTCGRAPGCSTWGTWCSLCELAACH